MSISIILIIIPISYAHFAYTMIANIYDGIIMICSLLSTISNLFFPLFFSPFSTYPGNVSQVYLCIVNLLFTASNFSFCLAGIILSHNLILFSFNFALFWFKNRKSCVKHTDSKSICTYQLYPGASYWTSLYINSSSVKQKSHSNFLKSHGDKWVNIHKVIKRMFGT